MSERSTSDIGTIHLMIAHPINPDEKVSFRVRSTRLEFEQFISAHKVDETHALMRIGSIAFPKKLLWFAEFNVADTRPSKT